MTVTITQDRAHQIVHYLGGNDITRETLSSGRWYYQGILEYNGAPNVETHKIDFGNDYSILKTPIHVVAKVITSNSWGTVCQHLIALNPMTHRFTVLCNIALSKDMTLKQVDRELNSTAYWPVAEKASFTSALKAAWADKSHQIKKVTVF
jgi:hypothetical protein